MVEQLHDEYKCILPAYKRGRLYKPGMSMFLPAGTEYESECFVLERKAVKVMVEGPAADESAPEKKTRKKKAQEVEG